MAKNMAKSKNMLFCHNSQAYTRHIYMPRLPTLARLTVVQLKLRQIPESVTKIVNQFLYHC